jgi:hypothetical protein
LFPVWLAGLWHFLFGRGTKYRALGWIYLVLLATFIVLHGKDYYLAPAYAMLLAGGGLAIEGWFERGRFTRGKLWPKAAVVTVILVATLLTAPIVLPMLSPEGQLAYRERLHIQDQKAEVHMESKLPQMFADQFGWPELVAEVGKFYQSLPPVVRENTAILAGNYGEAGAIDLFGPQYGLPAAISGHQNHYYWGLMGFRGDNFITIEYGPHYLGEICKSVEPVTFHSDPWGMGEENHEIYFCRGLKKPLADIFEDQKHWN